MIKPSLTIYLFCFLLLHLKLSQGLDFGQPCESQNDTCDAGFVCFRGTCQCSLTTSHYYSSDKKRCFKLAGAPCSGEPDDEYDSEFAKCSPNPRSSTGFSVICDVSRGYGEDSSRRCRPLLGMNCTSEYLEFIDNRCSWAADLTCVNGKCECSFGESQKWDELRSACVSKEGQQCYITSKYPWMETLIGSCDSGLYCNPVDIAGTEGLGLVGICRATRQPEIETSTEEESSTSSNNNASPPRVLPNFLCAFLHTVVLFVYFM